MNLLELVDIDIDDDIFPMGFKAFQKAKWIGLEPFVDRLHILVSANIYPRDHREKMVTVYFGFPGCMCNIVQSAIFDEDVEDEDAIERILQDCDLVLSTKLGCPKCGWGHEELVEIEEKIPFGPQWSVSWE